MGKFKRNDEISFKFANIVFCGNFVEYGSEDSYFCKVITDKVVMGIEAGHPIIVEIDGVIPRHSLKGNNPNITFKKKRKGGKKHGQNRI